MYKISLLIVLMVIVGCKKEEAAQEEEIVTETTIETIYPESYFPAYPGSFWEYEDSNGDTTRVETSPTYVLSYSQNGPNYYAPHYDGMVVRKYLISTSATDYHSSKWKRILPDELYVGNVFLQKYVHPSTDYSGTILAIDTSISINGIQYDSVIVVKESNGPNGNGTYHPLANMYYAKHIGVIRTEVYNGSGTITNTIDVIDYFVND